MKTVHIHCGIEGSEQHCQDKFWPVLQAVPLPYSWLPKVNKKYSAVFTSKIAVEFFSQWSLLRNAEFLCAVGPQTAHLIASKMHPACSNVLASVFYPQGEGLLNVLTQASFSPSSVVFIFTALNGKTESTLKEISLLKLPFDCKMLPLYKLELFENNFLQELFQDTDCIKNAEFVFHCRSGMVVNAAVKQLKKFFGCDSSSLLPSCYYFSGKKKTVQN